MTKEEPRAKVKYESVQFPDFGDLKIDTRVTPYQDNETDFLGLKRCTSNVLAKTNDAAAMAMCKDAK